MSDFLSIITEISSLSIIQEKSNEELIIAFPPPHFQTYSNNEIYQTPLQNSFAPPEDYTPPSHHFPDEEINEYLASKIRLLHEKNESSYYRDYFFNLIKSNQYNEDLKFQITFCLAHWDLYSRTKEERKNGFQFIEKEYFRFYNSQQFPDLSDRKKQFIEDYYYNIEGLGMSQSANGGPIYTMPPNIDMSHSWIYMDSTHSINSENLTEKTLILLHESQMRYEYAIPLIYRTVALARETYEFLKNINIIQ